MHLYRQRRRSLLGLLLRTYKPRRKQLNITNMKTNDFMGALNEARKESVKQAISNKDSKLAKLYAAKVAASDAYNKGERELLFSKGSTYAVAQRNIVRSAFRTYVLELTHNSKETEKVINWFDTNNIDKDQPIIDTETRLQSYCKATYDDYRKGMIEVTRKSKQEREKEKAEKLALVSKLATLSTEELAKLLESAK